MIRYKEKVGRSYEILCHNGKEVLVSFTYCCPYCLRETTVQREYSTGLDILEGKAFFEDLKCEHCGEIAEVRYLPHKRIIRK